MKKMKRTRRTAALISALMLGMSTLGFTACGSDTTGSDHTSSGADSAADTSSEVVLTDTDASESPASYDDAFAEEVKDRGYLIVGCKMDVPDLSYYDEETGEWSGLEVELAYKTAANLFGTDEQTVKDDELVHFVGVTVADREETLQAGDIDMMLATYTDTTEREEKFALSDTYYTDYIGIMVRSSGENANSLGSGDIKSIANLDGKYVGIPSNATTRADMIDYIETMTTSTVSPIFFEYSSYEKLFAALKNGDIDAMAVDVSILKGYVDSTTKILNDRFAGQHYAAAVQKGHESLLTYINQAIAE